MFAEQMANGSVRLRDDSNGSIINDIAGELISCTGTKCIIRRNGCQCDVYDVNGNDVGTIYLTDWQG